MGRSLLVKILGFPATLIHGDPLVWDRWRWLKKRLPRTGNSDQLLDVGCGTGAFSIGAAKRGYQVLGLSWDERNQTVAGQRAGLCNAANARFEVLDVRRLDAREDLSNRFDVAICFECIEHILDDRKLMLDMTRCLKPGGRLLLTAPYLHFIPINQREVGAYSTVEDGGHVRRGYSPAMLNELCQQAHLVPEHISYCSGYSSQRITTLMRALEGIHPILGWLAVLPLRILPPIFDSTIAHLTAWPDYSICLEAYKPRFEKVEPHPAVTL